MTDSLRDRIAAALGNVEVVLDGWDYLNETSKFLLADAVIAALGLRREWGSACSWAPAQRREELKLMPGETVKSRYVTEWEDAG